MGIFDNVKNRLGFGTPGHDDRDWHDEDNPEEYYEDGYPSEDGRYGDYDNGYGDGYGYGGGGYGGNGYGGGYGDGYGNGGRNGYGDGYGDYDDRPAPMRSYGVDRADYYNDNHAPLVSQTDVRSQPLLGTVPGTAPDRIPAPKAYRRSTQRVGVDSQGDDASAFKNGLARSPSSFAQLHTARLRMEDSGKIPAVNYEDLKGSTGRLEELHAPPGVYDGIKSGHVRQRVHRRVEYIVPVTYADAEQITVELRKGAVVVLDLRGTRPDLAKRILDFSFGVASALDGQVERYIDRVYLFAINGAILDAERAAIRI